MNGNKNNLQIGTDGPANKNAPLKSEQPHGVLAKFFGGIENAPTSISGFVLVLLIIVGVFITFTNTKVDPTDFWKTIVFPLSTALLGYLFGKGKK